MLKSYLLIISSWLILASCVTYTLNSDGSVQSSNVDREKLADTYVDLAIEYQKRGASQLALERVNLALATDSDNARAYMTRGMINQSLNQISAAEKDFKKALNLKANYPEALVNYAVFLCAQKRYTEANQNFASALNNPLYYTPEIGYYNRGKCEYRAGNWSAANLDYIKALSFHNSPAEVYIALAKLQYEQKNSELANYYINKYKNSQTPETLLLHIQILQSLIATTPSPTKLNEYTIYRNNLVKVLLTDYGDSIEAQEYLMKNKNASAYLAAANSSNLVNKPKTSGARRFVIVSSGDTLYSIAHKYSISLQQLKLINKLPDNVTKLGSTIYLDPQ